MEHIREEKASSSVSVEVSDDKEASEEEEEEASDEEDEPVPLISSGSHPVMQYLHGYYPKGWKHRLASQPEYYYVNSGSHVKPTHISMDGYRGGVIHVPPSKETEFLNLYGETVMSSHTPLYLCEIRTKIFRFYVDLDLSFTNKKKRVITPGQLTSLIGIIMASTMAFYPKTSPAVWFRMVMCQSPHSRNMHLIFPFLYVNRNQAMTMANAITADLELRLTFRIFDEPWDKMLDKAVYVSGSLRMVGSCKSTKCKFCQGKLNQVNCETCRGTGKVNLGRVYEITKAYEGKQEIPLQKLLRQPPGGAKLPEGKELQTLLVPFTSIRQLDATERPGWRRVPGCPVFNTDLPEVEDKASYTLPRRIENLSSTPKGQLNVPAEDTKVEQRQTSMMVDVPLGSTIGKLLQEQVRKFHRFYARVIVRSIRTNEKGNYFRVCVKGTGSNYCLNLKKEVTSDSTVGPHEHKSNSVYFLVRPTGVSQLCWCNCPGTQGRLFGLCKNFESSRKPLVNAVRLQLFPAIGASRLDHAATYKPGDAGAVLDRIISNNMRQAFIKNQAQKNNNTKKRKRPKA